jgi:oligopeptide transport system substrate-binding protein
MNRLARSLVFALVLALLVVGTVAAQDAKSVVVSAGPGDPRSVDPQAAIDTRDWYLLNPLFPALTTLDEESNQVEPGIVTGWDISEDGTVYTFHLIENIPWVRYNADTEAVEQVMDESGNPRLVTAHDVVYGWTRALDPATGSFGAYMLAPLVVGGQSFNSGEGSAEDLGLRAVDDFTFEVTAPESVAYALGLYGLLNARPTPQWAIEEFGDSWTEPENIQSYGPFALKEWVHEESMTYVKNPFWPGSAGYGQAKLDELVFRFLDNAVALREYEAGNIQVLQTVPSDQIARIKADATLSQELTIVAGACTGAWGFHVEKPPFDNVHIRRAFSYAVDRDSLVNDVLRGGAIPSRWFTPPSVALAPTLESNPDLGISFDPAKAQEELQLGLQDLGLSSADELPTITAVFGNSETNNAIGQALQIMWEDTLGIRVELGPMDTTTYWANMAEDAGQIHAAGWCPDYNDANNYTRDVMRSDGIYNYGRWNSPQFDQMVDEARSLSDPEARRALYAQIEQLMVVDEAAIIPLTWQSVVALTKPNVTRTFVPSGVQAFWKWDVTG